MKKKMKQFCNWLTGFAIVMAATFQAGCTQTGTVKPASSSAETEEFEPFIRVDRDDAEAWSKDLANVRFVKEGLYSFVEASEKYGINDIVPNEEGLADLCISGSAQFSLPQFFRLAEDLKEAAEGRQIWIVDLRRESHVLLGRIRVSVYDAHNFGNEGLTLEEIEKDEIERFGSMFGQTVSAYTREDDTKVDEVKINVQGILTEKELVESAGLSYLRIPVRDHTWPSPQEVDTFIDFLKGLDTDSIWLHFHCQAGKGRTACYMAMYDKMMNPEISCEDICVRQTRLGGNYILYTEQSDSYKAPLYEEKARMMRLFCRYVEENHDTGYKVSWSQWLKENDK